MVETASDKNYNELRSVVLGFKFARYFRGLIEVVYNISQTNIKNKDHTIRTSFTLLSSVQNCQSCPDFMKNL